MTDPALPADTDVIVAGSGAAGLTAALAAARGGARVLLVEKASTLGGTTALSFGRTWIPVNHLSTGDSPDAARTYLSGLFSDRYPGLIEAFVRSAPIMARYVERQTPLRFTACLNYPDYHPSRAGARQGGRALDVELIEAGDLHPLVQQIRRPPGYVPLTHAEWEQWRYPQYYDWALLQDRRRRDVLAGGTALAAGLMHGVLSAGVRVLPAAALVSAEPGASGTVHSAVIDYRGQNTTVGTGAVIIATGGFDRSELLRRRLLPAPVGATGAGPANTGDALRIAGQFGARTDNLDNGWWMPMIAVPDETIDGQPYYQSLIRERALPRQILINASGRRFVNEALPYNEIGKAMQRRDAAGAFHNAAAWMIFDEGFRRRFGIPTRLPGQPLPDWVAQDSKLGGLAACIGLDAGALAATIRRWNQLCTAGADLDFGRGDSVYDRYMGDPGSQPQPNLGPLDEPPYYAIRVLPGTIGTKGGPVTGVNGMVLGSDGEPIQGLYAAGNCAAFWTADGYPGPGATLAVAMTMGYLAGQDAAGGQSPR
jgi:3-oxosteroid 1-dehydrogenase